MAQGSLTPLILTATLLHYGSFQALAGPLEPPCHIASPKKPGAKKKKIKDKGTISEGIMRGTGEFYVT